ncbi:hypothetical protein [Actinophytocola sp.]|uniref:hypothetical protein n=1 Tax=Actinophytocola sp. TaxID=1872138 RepID=UPI003899D73F
MADNPYGKEATRMQGVHTILALPQSYLAYRLDVLLRTGHTTTGASLKKVRLPINDKGQLWLEGTVSALGITVSVPGSVGKVVFTVTFSAGQMDYYDVQAIPPVLSTCDIAGLTVGFLVDLAKAGVDVKDHGELPKDVQDLAAGLPPGSFTINELFLDLEKADLAQYDTASTVFPPKMPPSARSAFSTYLATYLDWIRQAKGHVLGYGVTVPEWHDPVASFPPASLDFVTNKYTAEKPDPADGKRDCLLYLMMTGREPLPRNTQPWWGNFVLPDDGAKDGWFGAMAMARSLFIDDFLARHLSPIVTRYWELGNTDDGLDLVKKDRTGSLGALNGGLVWNCRNQTGKSHRTNTFSNDDVVTTMSWDVSVTHTPGTDRLVITRVVDFDVDFTHWYGIEGHATSTSFHVWYHVPLTVTVTMAGVVDGRLQVTASSSYPQPDPTTLYDMPMGHLIVRSEGTSSIWESVADTLDKTVYDIVRAALDEAIGGEVATAVAQNLNLTPFVFPGGAQLGLVRPIFNTEGDLLFGASQKS